MERDPNLTESGRLVESEYYRPRNERAASVMRVNTLVDMMLAHPEWSDNELAAAGGVTRTWLSTMKNSAPFLARVAERRDELAPDLAFTVQERAAAVYNDASDELHKRIPEMRTGDLLNLYSSSSKNLGLGVNTVVKETERTFVVQVPARAPNSQKWQESLGDHGITVSEQ